VPTTVLEVLIYLAFIVTIALEITKNKKQKTNKLQIDFNLKISNSKRSIIHNSSFIIPIFLFIVSGIISVIIAPNKMEALGLFKAYILDPIIFFWVILLNFECHPESNNEGSQLNRDSLPNQFKDQNDNRIEIAADYLAMTEKMKLNYYNLIFNSLILSGVIVALHAIYQKITGHVADDGRVVGIFGYNPNYLAFYLSPILVLLHCFELHIIENDWKNIAKNYYKIWHYDIAFVLIAYAIYLTESRAAIAAVIIGVGSYYIMYYWEYIKSKKMLFFMLICSLILTLFIGWQITKPDWSATKTTIGRASSSNNIRWEIWNTTANDIIPHNLVWLKGVGLGNYQNYFSNLTASRVNYPEWISPRALTPHNIFLNIWMNLGLLGLVSFVWVIIEFFKFQITNNKLQINSNDQILNSKKIIIHNLPAPRVRATSESKTGRQGFLFIILDSMLITILIQGLVDSPIWKNDLAVMFWLILAIKVSIYDGFKKNN
jgi:O-antigen ligase